MESGLKERASVPDVADRHRRLLAYALLALGARYGVSATADLVGPGLASSLGILADGLALLAVGLVVVIFVWKARNLSGRDWHLYRNAEGFVARTIARSQSVSWIATLLFLILLEPWDGLSERLSTAFVLDASLAVMLLSFAGTYFYLDRADDA